MTSELPLRERKKVATRAALSHAAWSAMLSDGLDSVSPESVAAAVGVSSRTFRNYFAGVEEAIVDELAQRYLTLADQVGDRPPGAPVWESLMQGLPAALPAIMGDRDDFAVLLQAVNDRPTMLAQNLIMFERGRQRLTEVIAARTGADPARDLTPRLYAGAATTAMATAAELWARRATDLPLLDLLRTCLHRLSEGIGP